MEQNNIPTIAKKVWHIMRVAYFMLKKGICKKKILLDLNMMMKRGKIAGKNLSNLMFHHHNNHGSATTHGAPAPGEYEFSCSNTPLYRHYFTTNKRNKNRHVSDIDLSNSGVNFEAVSKVLDMMVNNNSLSDAATAASPLLPGLGFGQSPMPTRQLRITNSPFPIQTPSQEDTRVDQAAEDFIKRFYSQLKQQKY